MAHDEEYDIGPQEINAGSVALVGGVGAVVVLVLSLLTLIFFNRMQDSILQDKQLDAPDAYAADVVNPQKAKLDEYGPIDKAKGRLTVPIDKAMALTLAARAKNPDGPMGPPTPPPAAAGKAPEKTAPPTDAKETKPGGTDAKKH